jgi:uncharacterized membrane protein YphA (DoxX/SURF4 family)
MTPSAEPVSPALPAHVKLVRAFVLAGRLALAGIFLFASYSKMKPQVAMPWSMDSIKTSLSMFAMQVDSYQLLPPAQAIRVAHFLPPFELFLGLWLLSGLAIRFSSLMTSLVLTGFFALIVRTYALGLSINCGCFGSSEQVGPRKMFEDGSFLAFSLAVMIGAFWLYRFRTRKPRSGVDASRAAVSPLSR